MKISTVSTGNNTSIKTSKKSTAKACQSTFVDDAKNFMDKNTPSFVKKLIPEEFLRFNNNRNMLNKASVGASYANLPKKNGKVDLKRVNDCRKKAIDFITKKNKEAYDKLNYGCYKENLDSTKPLTLLIGPEIEHILGKTTDTSSINKYRFGFNDLMNNVNFSDKGAQDLKETLTVKPAHQIRDNIEKQNGQLKKLQSMDLSNEKNMKEFLAKYQEITGTGFSCDLIENALALNASKGSDKGEKAAATCKAFGLMESVTDAGKNKIQTDATFAAERQIVSGAMQRSPHPVVKAIGFCLPTIQLANDKLTEGCKEGEVINTRNITYKNFVTVASEGAVEGILANFTFKGNVATRTGKRTGVRAALSKGLNFVVKFSTPNWEDKSELINLAAPGYHQIKELISLF